jgi:hypothetical protein
VEEKLFMKRGKKWLNVTSRQKTSMKQENPCLGSRAEVRSLADLTGCFVLSLCVRVRCDLGDESNEH